MTMTVESPVYAQRRPLRRFMQWLSKIAFGLLTELNIEGEGNFPKHGPLLVVGNHFSFIDPAIFVRVAPWPMDFIGGAQFPHAPGIVHFLPKLWGYLPVYRGTGSTYALNEAEKILNKGGIVGIFPEAGSWAQILRPARPGAAYLSAKTGAPLLPIGIDGMPEVFPSLRKLQKAKVRIRVGKPFGPLKIKGKGYQSREQIDAFGHEIMHHIADLIPPEKAGIYSPDPIVREAAKGSEIYPWENTREGQDQYNLPES
ncbi:MAG: 1-acyl-sn-glycerol-3-phosphate acyltransferase [Chloroflexi bacterium]|nr:1-acyl-sn-glycerol-3-phosphate acyltransferase [Chloroflexota bacterium]